jgi:deoxyribose-phosphate aldolase
MNIAKYIDHTALKAEVTPADIKKLCAEARQYGFASVCVNSSFVPLAVDLLDGSDVNVCAVVGFPLGAMSTDGKLLEMLFAIGDGADEIDMVINVGRLKSGDIEYVRNEIVEMADVAHEEGAILKVIIETALLTDEEKKTACRLIDEAGADFGKSCTGFNGGGATVEDAKLMKAALGNKQLKMSAKIDNFELAKALIEAGADRLGASKSVAIVTGAPREDGDGY